jgi:redox-sensing transcriptional repressor
MKLEHQSGNFISSSELASRLGIAAHSIRKDISFLGEAGNTGAGYDVERLKGLLKERFAFGEEKRTCVVGLGLIGSAILENSQFAASEFKIVAGFDSSINRLETIKTDVDLFPAYQIAEIVKRLKIHFAIIAVPPSSAQDIADRLIEGDIKGILNFAPVVIRTNRDGVFVKNMNIAGELRILSALTRNRPV